MMMENDVRRKLAQDVSEFYESQGAVFSSKRTWPWDLMRLFESRLKSGDLLVDVGAGNGRLADTLPPDVRYLGIEPSAVLRQEAEKQLSTHQSSVIPAEAGIQFNILDPRIKSEDDNRRVVDGSLPKLNLPDNSADAAACIAVLHHIPSKEWREASVKELHRILKPGGCLILSVWNLRARRFWSWQTFKYAWLRLKGVQGGEAGDLNCAWKAGDQPQNRYVHAFTLQEFKSLFDPAAWAIERIGAYDRGAWRHWTTGRNLVGVAIKK